jgi:hypothetical protein
MINPLSKRLPTTEDDQREIATEGCKDSHRLRMPRNDAPGGANSPSHSSILPTEPTPESHLVECLR